MQHLFASVQFVSFLSFLKSPPHLENFLQRASINIWYADSSDMYISTEGMLMTLTFTLAEQTLPSAAVSPPKNHVIVQLISFVLELS